MTLLEEVSRYECGLMLGQPNTFVVAALHLLRRHDEAAEAPARLDVDHRSGWGFVDLTELFTGLLISLGKDDA